jgi:hypothetical protein
MMAQQQQVAISQQDIDSLQEAVRIASVLIDVTTCWRRAVAHTWGCCLTETGHQLWQLYPCTPS